MSGVLIVGGGIAGQAACEALRERDPDVPIALVCGEPRLPYDRVKLSHLLAASTDADALQLRPDDWYGDRDIELRVGRSAVALDPDGGTCTLDDGELLRFDRCVLATGSTPLMPPLPGLDQAGVHLFRGPEDCTAILAAAEHAERAAVIGGGLLGLEAAYGLAAHGCPVSVVHLLDRLMERQLDDARRRRCSLPRWRASA